MVLTRAEAFSILNLKEDADKNAIRQSYKELALRWHPDKNADAEAATKKFQEISCAYKKLMTDGDADDEEDNDDDIMTAEDMFSLFRHMYFAGGAESAGLFSSLLEEIMQQQQMSGVGLDDDMYDSADFDDEDFEDDEDFFDYDAGTADFFMPSNHFTEDSYATSYRRFHPVTEEEAKRNAEELLKEEEEEKAEAKKKEDKRKNKNKRKKEAKKRKKASHGNGKSKAKTTGKKTSDDEESDDGAKASEEEGDFDMTSAFVRSRAGAATSAKAPQEPQRKTSQESSPARRDAPPAATAGATAAAAAASRVRAQTVHSSVGQATAAQVPVSGDTDDVSVQARSYAMRGNELAQLGHYQAAIDMFSEAIKLHSADHRYYGNRSFCYDRLSQYHNAERDASKAIDLSPEWPKGYFRRARALAGQRQWKEAEDSFEVVLALDPSCTDAFVELKKIRASQLEDMGFSHEQCLLAVDKYQNVPRALEALLSGAIFQKDPDVDAVYASDDASDVQHHSSVRFTSREDLCTPNASTGICSVWVGNVNHSLVGQSDVRALFERFGEISSIRTMPAKHCVFVNYCSAQSAANAMKELQGYFIGDMNLTVRYPDSYLPAQETMEAPRPSGSRGAQHGGHDHGRGRGAAAPKQRAVGAQARAAAARQRERISGAAQAAASGGAHHSSGKSQECKNWRGSGGCSFGKKCRFVHVPEHRGVDARR